MPTNAEVFEVDAQHRSIDGRFDQNAWHHKFSKAWSYYLTLGRAKHLNGFYSWALEEATPEAIEAAKSEA